MKMGKVRAKANITQMKRRAINNRFRLAVVILARALCQPLRTLLIASALAALADVIR